MKYLKKLFSVLMWPIIYMIGFLLINYIFVAIFNLKLNLSNDELLQYINTLEYKELINNYFVSNILLITTIIFIIFVPIFYILFKKYRSTNKFHLKDTVIPILFGITISLVYNITAFNLNNLIHFTSDYEISKIPLIIDIICTGIMVPIIEELLFRGIVYNKLKEFNKPMRAIILSSLIFSLCHSNVVDAIYAFGVSFMFIYLYEKYKNIKASIVMHMFLNITIIIMLRVIIINYTLVNMVLLSISLLILIILRKYSILER